MTDIVTVMTSAEFGEIRTVLRDGEPWFVAKDVCDILGIANNRDAVARLDEDEKGVGISDTLGGKQEVSIVNEFGLYQLILRSNKPEAKQFKRWVTHDVLPAIRKQGYYSMIKDEDLIAIISERRKENAEYLLDGLAERYEKTNSERYKQLRRIWNTRRFDMDLEQVDTEIDKIWYGDALGAEDAKKHYRDLYFSKLGMSRVYGQWKEPKTKRRTFRRERELINMYERVGVERALKEVMNKEYTIEDCASKMELLKQQDRVALQRYNEMRMLRMENEQLRKENDKFREMLGIAISE